jgi:hypothetical protein
MTKARLKKAKWIAEQLDANQDDVYDVLLGNITAPYEFYNSVESLEREYDATYDKMMTK